MNIPTSKSGRGDPRSPPGHSPWRAQVPREPSVPLTLSQLRGVAPLSPCPMCILFQSPLHRTTPRLTEYRQSTLRQASPATASSVLNPPSHHPGLRGALPGTTKAFGVLRITHRHATRPTSLTPGHGPPLRQEGLQSVLWGPPGC